MADARHRHRFESVGVGEVPLHVGRDLFFFVVVVEVYLPLVPLPLEVEVHVAVRKVVGIYRCIGRSSGSLSDDEPLVFPQEFVSLVGVEEGGVCGRQFVEQQLSLRKDIELYLFDFIRFARIFEAEQRFTVDMVFVAERMVVYRVRRIGERIAEPVDVESLPYGRVAAYVLHVDDELDRVER